MAFIPYIDLETIPEKDKVADTDNIVRIQAIYSQLMKQHYEFYKLIMWKRGPLKRSQREMIAVIVSKVNGCGY
ncbi:carboxymuconolactone decarboxylase family protein [Candidatus Cloacimonadota bacterium]